MGGVRHAIVQCYVKEPLLKRFAACEVLKRERQSKSSAMTRRPGRRFLPTPTPLSVNFTHDQSQGQEMGAFIGKYAAPPPPVR